MTLVQIKKNFEYTSGNIIIDITRVKKYRE